MTPARKKMAESWGSQMIDLLEARARGGACQLSGVASKRRMTLAPCSPRIGFRASGDTTSLRAMLAADVCIHADGGGRRSAAREPILGREAVMETLEHLAVRFQRNGSKLVRLGYINGLPGFMSLEADGGLQTTALDHNDEMIVAIYVVRNPDKLRHLQ